jgi:TRAP-type C4-dicarboxylate transport system permease small subunit
VDVEDLHKRLVQGACSLVTLLFGCIMGEHLAARVLATYPDMPGLIEQYSAFWWMRLSSMCGLALLPYLFLRAIIDWYWARKDVRKGGQ